MEDGIMMQTIPGIPDALLIDILQIMGTLGVLFGAIFVGLQLRSTNKQSKMDMIMRLYEFANSVEFQAAWLTVLQSKIGSFEDFEKLPPKDQVSFYQVAALFESLGVLLQRKAVTAGIVDDMFLTELAWRATKPFVMGMRSRFGADDNYYYFERLYQQLEQLRASKSLPT